MKTGSLHCRLQNPTEHAMSDQQIFAACWIPMTVRVLNNELKTHATNMWCINKSPMLTFASILKSLEDSVGCFVVFDQKKCELAQNEDGCPWTFTHKLVCMARHRVSKVNGSDGATWLWSIMWFVWKTLWSHQINAFSMDSGQFPRPSLLQHYISAASSCALPHRSLVRELQRQARLTRLYWTRNSVAQDA